MQNTTTYKKFIPDKNTPKPYVIPESNFYTTFDAGEKSYSWNSDMDKVRILREGIPYQSIEIVGQRMHYPIKDVLDILDLPQTTYNKKLREHALLNSRDSELILTISELIDYGLYVFHHESEKFHRWLKKSNISLGGITPDSLLDSMTGIQEVKNALHRIEYGNFA